MCWRRSNLLRVSFAELNNTKTGCYIGEVLLNHLMFADAIFVYSPSLRGLQSILDVCQAYAESYGIIFNCSKTICVTFKAKTAKSTVTPLLTLCGQTVKSVNHYKYLGIVLYTELSDDKDRDNCDINIVQQANCKPPNVQMQLKMYFFIPFVRPCMHHNYGVISESHACRYCVRPIAMHAEIACGLCRFGCRVPYNLPWRASVSSHQVQCNIPTFEALLKKTSTGTCFSKDAESPTTYGCML